MIKKSNNKHKSLSGDLLKAYKNTMKKILIAALLLLSACVAPDEKPVGTMTVSNRTWGSFQEYLGRIGSNHPGAFAIGKDGDGSYYIWCADVLCAGGPTYKRDALKGCERYGIDCVIFAFGRDILVPYKLEERAAYVPDTTVSSAAPTDTKQTQRISNSLKSEINHYLAGSKVQTGRYRYLAVNPSGDRLGLSISCRIKKSGWGGWTSEGCGEDQAKQLAIDDCGSDCRIIYEGEHLDPAIRIEWY
ncbi:hypothetical protein [Dongia sp.]|uniref:hypothetical protein n=1 Tax=Dongia sp. TaxID=1977262 RepID=UPI0035B1E8A5